MLSALLKAMVAKAVALVHRRPPHRHPLLAAMLAQAHQLQHPHQALALEHLAACWLEAPQRRHLRRVLQERLLHLHRHPSRPSSLRNSSSRKRTARRTGKRRR